MYNYVLHIYRQYVTGKQYEEILEPTAKKIFCFVLKAIKGFAI